MRCMSLNRTRQSWSIRGIVLAITEAPAKYTVETDAKDIAYGIYFDENVISERRSVADQISLIKLKVLQKVILRLETRRKTA